MKMLIFTLANRFMSLLYIAFVRRDLELLTVRLGKHVPTGRVRVRRTLGHGAGTLLIVQQVIGNLKEVLIAMHAREIDGN